MFEFISVYLKENIFNFNSNSSEIFFLYYFNEHRNRNFITISSVYVYYFKRIYANMYDSRVNNNHHNKNNFKSE